MQSATGMCTDEAHHSLAKEIEEGKQDLQLEHKLSEIGSNACFPKPLVSPTRLANKFDDLGPPFWETPNTTAALRPVQGQ